MRLSKITASRLALSLFISLSLFPAWARADIVSEREIAPGVKHIFMRKESGPWEINILKANPSEAKLSAVSVSSKDYTGGNTPLSRMVAAASSQGNYVIGAVNGDYFRRAEDAYAGDPFGLQISKGELLSFPLRARSALLIDGDGKMRIDRTRVTAWVTSSRGLRHAIHGMNQVREAQQLDLYTPRFGTSTSSNSSGIEAVLETSKTSIPINGEITGKVIEIVNSGNANIPPHGMVLSGHGSSAWFLNQLKAGDDVTLSFNFEPANENIVEAVGGGPRIVRAGQISVEAAEEGFTPAFASQRNPRTAVGLSPKSILLVTVDGRRPGRSAGMSLNELAAFMLSLGCEDALNLDGGGSTEMIIKDEIVNNPSDGHERPLANSLMLFAGLAAGTPASITLQPEEPAVLAGGQVLVRLQARDQYFNPMQLPLQQITWKVSPASLGTVNSEGMFSANINIQKATDVLVEADYDKFSTRAIITAYPLPKTLQVVPKKLYIGSGALQQFVVEGKSAANELIPPLLLQPQWSCSSEIGAINKRGFFLASPKSAKGFVTAQLGGVTAQAEVVVLGNTTPKGIKQ